MQQRRLGRLGHMSTVLIYGAAALAEVDQDVADRSVQLALDAGINHFDVAASYGDAELRLGPWMPRIRDDIFLATKTEQRDRDSSWRQINHSIERLRTDHVDLIQIHAVGDLAELDRVTAADGSLQAVTRAREEGLARAIGITGHGHAAPATHLEALRRFAAVVWVLSHEEVTGIATPGDVRLLPYVIEAEKHLGELRRDEAEEVLSRAPDYSSPFIDMPF